MTNKASTSAMTHGGRRPGHPWAGTGGVGRRVTKRIVAPVDRFQLVVVGDPAAEVRRVHALPRRPQLPRPVLGSNGQPPLQRSSSFAPGTLWGRDRSFAAGSSWSNVQSPFIMPHGRTAPLTWAIPGAHMPGGNTRVTHRVTVVLPPLSHAPSWDNRALRRQRHGTRLNPHPPGEPAENVATTHRAGRGRCRWCRLPGERMRGELWFRQWQYLVKKPTGVSGGLRPVHAIPRCDELPRPGFRGRLQLVGIRHRCQLCAVPVGREDLPTPGVALQDSEPCPESEGGKSGVEVRDLHALAWSHGVSRSTSAGIGGADDQSSESQCELSDVPERAESVLQGGPHWGRGGVMSAPSSTERTARNRGLSATVASVRAKHTHGRRPSVLTASHRSRSHLRRTGPCVIALSGLALLAAACSNNRDAASSISTTTSRSPMSSTVPSTSTTLPPASISVPSSTTTTASSTGTSTSTQPPSASTGNEYAACMRSHGVTDFPDPPAPGSAAQTINPQGLDPNSPTFQSAQEACAKSAPTGGGAAS
jgi:hypothetical protein